MGPLDLLLDTELGRRMNREQFIEELAAGRGRRW